MMEDLINPVSPLMALACVLVALLTAWVIQSYFSLPMQHGRFETIDGLRGYLAFFVFLHHSSIWFYYLQTGQWQVPPSNLYSHFGSSSVALFFMITSFLFTSKLLESGNRNIDWRILYISRICRLTPLYLTVVLLVALTVGVVSDWQMAVSFAELIRSVLRWVFFTVGGAPDINLVPTGIMVAGVTWSLPLEWLFYFSLPILDLILNKRLNSVVLAVTLTLVILVGWIAHPDMSIARCFFGGVVAAFLVRFSVFQKWAKHPIASLLVLGCLYWVVTHFSDTFKSKSLLLLSVAFTLIASGTSFFGLLNQKFSKLLGEVSYSIYLLHGLILFVFFNFGLGIDFVRSLNEVDYSFLVLMLTPLIVLIAYVSYRLIELPFIKISASLKTTFMRI